MFQVLSVKGFGCQSANGVNSDFECLEELRISENVFYTSSLAELPSITQKIVLDVDVFVRSCDKAYRQVVNLELRLVEPRPEVDLEDDFDDWYPGEEEDPVNKPMSWVFVIKSLVKCFPNLEKLSITTSDLDPLADQWFAPLASLKNLKQLSLTGFSLAGGSFLQTAGFESLADVRLRNFPHLVLGALQCAKRVNPTLDAGRIMVLPNRTNDNERYVV